MPPGVFYFNIYTHTILLTVIRDNTLISVFAW